MYVYASVWMVPDAIRDARSGYVLEVRATTAEAKAAELQRQLKANSLVIEAYQTQVRNDAARDETRAAAVEKQIAEYEAARRMEPDNTARVITPADIEFLRK